MKNNTNQKVVSISFNLKEKKCWIVIIIAVLCAVLCAIADASIKVSAILVTGIVMIAPLNITCSKAFSVGTKGAWCLGTIPLTLFCTQLLLNQKFIALGIQKLLLGCLVVEILIGFLYLLIGRVKSAVIAGATLLLLLTTLNYFVYSFRGSEFAPYDIMAFTTAVKVAEQYQYRIDAPFAYAWVIFAAWISVGECLRGGDDVSREKTMMFGLIVEILAVLVLCIGLGSVEKLVYRNEGTIQNGYLLNFVKRIDFTTVDIPEGYDTDVITRLELMYRDEEKTSTDCADIIVVMNESFADVRIMGELQTNTDVMPFFDSLLDNTIHGYALAPTIGGGTCNSEWQFLTGNNMGFVADGVYPYQQYINDVSWSFFAEMEMLGYKTVTTHPEQATNWMRETVYSRFGVDETHFLDQYPQKNLIRQHVSDLETYEKVTELYEENCVGKDSKVCLLAVTMQNHGGYDSEGYCANVKLEGYSQEYPAVEQYLSLINSSDAALEYLIDYYEKIQRDVVILLFGDHLPQFADSFYEDLHGGPFDTLEEQMLQYTVPFFIWANYDIEEKDIGLTSLNFLSNFVYEIAGLPLPAYNAFLEDVREVIPAMNVFGYYSNEKGAFIPYEEAEGEEAEMLELYRILQYNCLFDKNNRSEVFFSAA